MDIPGLTQTINVPAGGGVVFIASDGGFVSASGSEPAFVDLQVLVNGSPAAGVRRVCVEGTASIKEPHGVWSLGRMVTLAAGTHTIKVQGASVTAQDAIVSGNSSSVYNAALSVYLIRT